MKPQKDRKELQMNIVQKKKKKNPVLKDYILVIPTNMTF